MANNRKKQQELKNRLKRAEEVVEAFKVRDKKWMVELEESWNNAETRIQKIEGRRYVPDVGTDQTIGSESEDEDHGKWKDSWY